MRAFLAAWASRLRIKGSNRFLTYSETWCLRWTRCNHSEVDVEQTLGPTREVFESIPKLEMRQAGMVGRGIWSAFLWRSRTRTEMAGVTWPGTR
jgi:hypothetical protein